MAIAALSAQGFHAKKLFTSTGAPETLANADIVTGMIAGPLRDAWSATYGSQALARTALQNVNGTIRYTSRDQVISATTVTMDVNVDGGGLPTIDTTAPANAIGIIELLIRHSIVR